MHLVNAKFYLPATGFAPAVIRIVGDRIASVESAGTEPSDDAIDLGGGYVVPGLADTHFHLTSLALKSQRCDLSAVRSADELAETMRVYAGTQGGPHVVGVDWDEGGWEDSSYPTRAMLDAIDARRPLLARRVCGHIGVVNSVLLRLIAPNAELIDAEAGVLREHALWEANQHCTAPPEALTAGIDKAIGELHRLGVTAIHDIVEPARFEPYLEGVKRSKRPLRIDALIHTNADELPRFDAMCGDLDPAYFRIAGVKCFLDGSMGGHTAALNAPYTTPLQARSPKGRATSPKESARGKGNVGGRGTLLMDTDDLRNIARGALEAGRMCAMHAIGDRAIDQACEVLGEFPAGSPNFRIEHCEIVGPSQLDRLRHCRPLLAMQPNFIRVWSQRGGLYEERLGKERLAWLNPLRDLRDAGLEMIFGSDGMPPGPIYGMKGATHHPIEAQRLTGEETLDAFTRAANAAGFHRRNAGVIERGRLADLTVLDKDPLTTDTDSVRVTHTIIGGRLVYG